MRSIFQDREEQTRPRGITALAWLFMAFALLIAIYGYLIWGSRIPFTSASWLIGIDAAQMGPVIFAIGASVYAACGIGLLRMNRWARWLGILLLVFGLAEQVPAVSAAVAEFHLGTLLREGVFFVLRVVCIRYLFQEDVRELFD
jgi:hypothetical protein